MKRNLNGKRTVQNLFGVLVLFLFGLSVFSGCSDSVSILKPESETAEIPEKETEEIPEGKAAENPEEKAAENPEGKTEEETTKISEEEIPQMIFVDVCGAVNAPGVYELSQGSRIFHAVERAGGFREDAAAELVNQADFVKDGQQIRIYTREEAEQQAEAGVLSRSGSGNGVSENSGSEAGVSGEDGLAAGLVNINRADKAALMTLTGIGETRAEAILAYREAHGGFSAVEELMQVEGIKEKTYEKLKDKITVD